MARTIRVKKSADAVYHIVSRVAGKRFLFSPAIKGKMVDILEVTAEFSGVSVLSYCIMDNHFHIVGKVPYVGSLPAEREAAIPEGEVLRRIGVLKGSKEAERISRRWDRLRERDQEAVAVAEANRWRRRMNDLSEFVKTFKETFDRYYRRDHEYNGSIWDGRFRSTCVEDGKYLKRVARYVDLNPVRAGIVGESCGYEWCTAVGNKFAVRCRAALAAELRDMVWGQTPEEREEIRLLEKWMRERKIPQYVSGIILGSVEFVQSLASVVAWRGRTPKPWEVMEGSYSTHGHKLAWLEEQNRAA